MSNAQMVQHINDAMKAHIAWKIRLLNVINTGATELTPEVVACDDRCDFGQWLHGPKIDGQTRAGMPYQVIVRLHAEFHKVASQVLKLAVEGRKQAAEQLLNGDYYTKSQKLVTALVKWKGELS